MCWGNGPKTLSIMAKCSRFSCVWNNASPCKQLYMGIHIKFSGIKYPSRPLGHNVPSKVQPIYNQHSICRMDNSIQVLKGAIHLLINLNMYNDIRSTQRTKQYHTKNNLRSTIMPGRDNVLVILMAISCAAKINNLNSTWLWQPLVKGPLSVWLQWKKWSS